MISRRFGTVLGTLVLVILTASILYTARTLSHGGARAAEEILVVASATAAPAQSAAEVALETPCVAIPPLPLPERPAPRPRARAPAPVVDTSGTAAFGGRL